MSDCPSPRLLRDAFGTFATGVTVITALRPDGQPVGITANSFTSVSLDPPLILWCIARESSSVAAFGLGASFAVTVLGEREKDVALHFASRTTVKFPDGATPCHQRHAPLISGIHPCRMDCRVENVYPAGDHLIVLGRVEALNRLGGMPLAFHDGRFGKLVPDTVAAPLNVWDPPGVEMPSIFNVPFE